MFGLPEILIALFVVFVLTRGKIESHGQDDPDAIRRRAMEKAHEDSLNGY